MSKKEKSSNAGAPGSKPADWSDMLDELSARSIAAERMGGPEKVARQHGRGKMDVRARLAMMADKGSFDEIGKLAGKGAYNDDGSYADSAPANLLFGTAKVKGRDAILIGDDFTVRGGAADASIWRKGMLAEQMASEYGLPLVRLIDGTGGGGSVKMLEDMGLTYVPYLPGWEFVVRNLATVPVAALALGPVAGLGAARLVASHYCVMVKGLSQVFTAGPQVVSALGEDLDKEGLGGAQIHGRNGVVDDVVDSEEAAFEAVRTFLSYLPDKAGDPLPKASPLKPKGSVTALRSIVPRDSRKAYSMRQVLTRVLDHKSFFEIGAGWGRSVITALARIDGQVTAVVASDPSFMGGSWTADAAKKLARFVQLADLFQIPVAHFVDNPGFMIGLEAEKAATIRHGVEALNDIYRTKVPWATIVIRKAYGVAGAAMSDHTRFQYRAAWPSADWGSLPLDGGIEVAYQSDLAASDDPEALLASIRQKLDAVRSPFRTAEAFLIEDIIDPAETRPFLQKWRTLAEKA